MDKTALSFSAGKDSAACLYILEDRWDDITVIWCNPGDPYEETLRYMERIKALVPHFVEVNGDVRAWIHANGHPVDILPWRATHWGRAVEDSASIAMAPYFDCCGANLWQPMNRYIKANRFNVVIRGQKDCDRMRSPIEHGSVIEGVRYEFPIRDWSDADVLGYLGDRLPPSYKRGRKASLDCKRCTAYVQDHSLQDLQAVDPKAAEEVRAVYEALRAEFRELEGRMNA
jgi:phosphoadenosine phosphosulfate reductase